MWDGGLDGGWGAGWLVSLCCLCHLSMCGDKWPLGIYSDSLCSAEHLADRGGGAWLLPSLFAKDKNQPQIPNRKIRGLRSAIPWLGRGELFSGAFVGV